MRFFIATLLLASSVGVSIAAQAEDNVAYPAVHDAMVLNKWAGACGMLDSLFAFQAVARTPGAGEFLLRFLDSESARLGLTRSSFLETCKGAGEHYAEMEKMATAKPQRPSGPRDLLAPRQFAVTRTP